MPRRVPLARLVRCPRRPSHASRFGLERVARPALLRRQIDARRIGPTQRRESAQPKLWRSLQSVPNISSSAWLLRALTMTWRHGLPTPISPRPASSGSGLPFSFRLNWVVWAWVLRPLRAHSVASLFGDRSVQQAIATDAEEASQVAHPLTSRASCSHD